MKKLIPLKIAKKIISDAVSNTYTDVVIIGKISDSLKTLALSYMYGEGNNSKVYNSIHDREHQELMIDFIYEVYYAMQSYGYGEEYLKELKSSVSKYIGQSSLSSEIKQMVKPNESEQEIDILFGIFVFLRVFLRQLDAELIKRNNQEQKINFTNQNKER